MFPNAKLKTDRPNFLARRGNRALSRGNCALVFQVMVHAHIRARFLDSSPRFFCALHLGHRRDLCALSAPNGNAFNNYDLIGMQFVKLFTDRKLCWMTLFE
ncbi:hypothetical protein HanXRQr2_Chr12g0554591 [Helianthus annuus]|uniref:Uncharacterized protein n=1 Tax=Helianthus annuus TaxID=4232 RepID=A0A9K3HIX4_HELAN|nr:hypothetical protein HanXRQr2_Chr12g0554591 [Helianthus annuus]KAJ0863778.1 hypothetical protein HanPSC8_Chr12g0533991 [Helianthus annuus]